jgi:hypothetical protein
MECDMNTTTDTPQYVWRFDPATKTLVSPYIKNDDLKIEEGKPFSVSITSVSEAVFNDENLKSIEWNFQWPNIDLFLVSRSRYGSDSEVQRAHYHTRKPSKPIINGPIVNFPQSNIFVAEEYSSAKQLFTKFQLLGIEIGNGQSLSLMSALDKIAKQLGGWFPQLLSFVSWGKETADAGMLIKQKSQLSFETIDFDIEWHPPESASDGQLPLQKGTYVVFQRQESALGLAMNQEALLFDQANKPLQKPYIVVIVEDSTTQDGSVTPEAYAKGLQETLDGQAVSTLLATLQAPASGPDLSQNETILGELRRGEEGRRLLGLIEKYRALSAITGGSGTDKKNAIRTLLMQYLDGIDLAGR